MSLAEKFSSLRKSGWVLGTKFGIQWKKTEKGPVTYKADNIWCTWKCNDDGNGIAIMGSSSDLSYITLYDLGMICKKTDLY